MLRCIDEGLHMSREIDQLKMFRKWFHKCQHKVIDYITYRYVHSIIKPEAQDQQLKWSIMTNGPMILSKWTLSLLLVYNT